MLSEEGDSERGREPKFGRCGSGVGVPWDERLEETPRLQRKEEKRRPARGQFKNKVTFLEGGLKTIKRGENSTKGRKTNEQK